MAMRERLDPDRVLDNAYPRRVLDLTHTLAGPDGFGACQCRQMASSRQTRHTVAPSNALSATGWDSWSPATATRPPEIAKTQDPDQIEDDEHRRHERRLPGRPPCWRRLPCTGERHHQEEATPAMAHLTLAGLSDDGKRLLLLNDLGVEFTLDADERLRAALRGDHARLGQLEIKMDSVLRPRDIQARIRAGETPEAVARLAQTTVEAIMPFAAPVLAERQHVADRAQRSSVRRTGQSAGARTLGDAVGANLRGLNIDPGTVEWDSARREDGKWSLTGEFSAPGRSGIAKFVFDAPGNYVVVDNDDATWLVGDGAVPAASAAERSAGDDITRARARRMVAAGEEQLPLGDDAISMVRDEPDTGTVKDEQPVEAHVEGEPVRFDDPAADAVAGLDSAEQGETESTESPKTPEADEPGAKPPKKRGRASVPSWDEIMFGGSTTKE